MSLCSYLVEGGCDLRLVALPSTDQDEVSHSVYARKGLFYFCSFGCQEFFKVVFQPLGHVYGVRAAYRRFTFTVITAITAAVFPWETPCDLQLPDLLARVPQPNSHRHKQTIKKIFGCVIFQFQVLLFLCLLSSFEPHVNQAFFCCSQYRVELSQFWFCHKKNKCH